MTPTAAPVAVIVVAAGSGTRLGAAAPKAFASLGARAVLDHALDGVAGAEPDQIVIVAPAGWEAAAAAAGARTGAEVVTGAATRQGSVAAGLAALRPEIGIVLVHDAARALAPAEVFTRVVDEVRRTAAGVIPVLPVVDSLKAVDGSSVVAGVDRERLAAAQTPQGFPRETLVAAYAAADAEHTDDAALFAAARHPVSTVAGDARAFKITTPSDLERAAGLVAGARVPRVGVGTDVHAFGRNGSLWLAGLEWPGESALSGHSDGDAVAHAIVDALLSAAGLGDIGTHFGTDHPEYAGAHADVFLARTLSLLYEAGWSVGSVSVQIQANRPRFAARRQEAEAVLSAALAGAPVSVSATTTDGLGFTGRGEGVAAFAVATVIAR